MNIPDPGDREVVPVVDLAGQVGGDSLPDLHHLAGVGAEEGFGDPQVVPDAVPAVAGEEEEGEDGWRDEHGEVRDRVTSPPPGYRLKLAFSLTREIRASVFPLQNRRCLIFA